MTSRDHAHTAGAGLRGAYPAPPREPELGAAGPTYVANDGKVWRRAMGDWSDLHPMVAERLLAGFRADAANPADWFHPRAAALADELEAAMRAVGILKH